MLAGRLGGSASSFSFLQGLRPKGDKMWKDFDQMRRAKETWQRCADEQHRDQLQKDLDYLNKNIFAEAIPETDWDAELKKLCQGD